MKIEQYISQLLYRYQCVTVPGFGAFLTEFQSAQLDKTNVSFRLIVPTEIQSETHQIQAR